MHRQRLHMIEPCAFNLAHREAIRASVERGRPRRFAPAGRICYLEQAKLSEAKQICGCSANQIAIHNAQDFIELLNHFTIKPKQTKDN